MIGDQIKDKKEVLVLAVLMVAIVFTGYYCLLLNPKLRTIKATFPQVRTTKIRVQTAGRDIADIDAIRHKIELLRREIGSYEARLPADEEIPSLLEYLSAVAFESRVKIVEIRPLREITAKEISPGEPKKLYLKVPVVIEALSGYHELGSFINKLENSPRFMKIDDIQIQGNPKDPKNHHSKLLISTFVLPKE